MIYAFISIQNSIAKLIITLKFVSPSDYSRYILNNYVIIDELEEIT